MVLLADFYWQKIGIWSAAVGLTAMMLAFAVADGKRCMFMKKGIEKYCHYSSTGDNGAISFGSLFNAKRFFELGGGLGSMREWDIL